MRTHDQMVGIRISKQGDVYDALLTEGGAFDMAVKGIASASAMQTRLMQFRSELVDHPLINPINRGMAGTDYYGVVFDVSKAPLEQELEFRRVILGTPGVLEILRMVRSQVDHSEYIIADVRTQWGAVTVSQEVTPL